jgi:hypothetical protein
MRKPKVLLLRLTEKMSPEGSPYLVGNFGPARLIGHRAREPDQYGNTVWEIHAVERDSEPSKNGDR